MLDGSFTIDGTTITAGRPPFTVEDNEYGHGALACAYLCQLASGQGSTVTQDSLCNGLNKILNALMENEDNYRTQGASAAKSFEEVVNGVLAANGAGGKTVSSVINSMNNGLDDAAQFALDAIDRFKGALIGVSTIRSYYGALQNRLEHTIRNLDNVVENTSAAESLIRDTAMSEEMVRYSNNNILAQAGQMILAQSNQSNQGVLSLLQ